jgi:hypothetical protein
MTADFPAANKAESSSSVRAGRNEKKNDFARATSAIAYRIYVAV